MPRNPKKVAGAPEGRCCAYCGAELGRNRPRNTLYCDDRCGERGRARKAKACGAADYEDPWKTDKNGYVVRSARRDGERVTELQHRVVFEEYLGRKLVGHENVHHINGDRADNRLRNLELWSVSQPAGQRVEDKLEWAREIVHLYGDAVERKAIHSQRKLV